MTLQALYFIIGFLIILGIFIYFIRFLSHRLNDRIPQKTFDLVERTLIAGIVIGVVAMFQPWVFVAFRLGFMIVLFATLGFIAWSHVTPAATQYDESNSL